MSAAEDARNMVDEPVPMQIRNAPTKLMNELGYGEGYKYAHDYEGHITDLECMPDNLIGKEYYIPSEEGLEKRVKERKAQIKEFKEKLKKGKK